jgi:hypothetical protein
MSEDYTVSEGKVVCPYCEHKFYPDDFVECGESAEWQCPECEKNFYMTWEWNPTFRAYQAPCLNGEPHNYAKMIGAPKEYFIGKVRCKYCDHEETNLELWKKL